MCGCVSTAVDLDTVIYVRCVQGAVNLSPSHVLTQKIHSRFGAMWQITARTQSREVCIRLCCSFIFENVSATTDQLRKNVKHTKTNVRQKEKKIVFTNREACGVERDR